MPSDDNASESRWALARFPEASDEGSVEIRLSDNLAAVFEYDDAQVFWVHFTGISAVRFRESSFSPEQNMVMCFDQLVEVFNSRWVEEVKANLRTPRQPRILRHFMFYVALYGCVEVLAEDWETGGMPALPPDQYQD